MYVFSEAQKFRGMRVRGIKKIIKVQLQRILGDNYKITRNICQAENALIQAFY